MSNYNFSLNPLTGQLQLVIGASALAFKGSVDTAASLPSSGNTTNDCYVVLDTNRVYVYSGSTWVNTAPSALIA